MALSTSHGYDISWPQCGGPQPAHPYGFGIVGVTGGRAFTTNPCLGDQVTWASAGGSGAGVYINVNHPRDGRVGQALTDYGVDTVRHAVAYAEAQRIRPPMWWLDVETMNYWSADTTLNALIIQGAIDELHRLGLAVGIYSTSYQWGVIAGGFSPG